MTRSMLVLGLTAVLLGAVPTILAAADQDFNVDMLADGVHLFRPAESDAGFTNSLVVERTDGLLVIGAQPDEASALRLLAAIRRVSDASVRYLVLPHPHALAAGGATAFPAATLVIGSQGCLEALSDRTHDFGAEIRARAENPADWKEPARRLPVLVVESRVLLDDPRNPVRLLSVSDRAHSAGDLFVSLPEPDLLYIGALLFEGQTPYAGDAFVGRWLGTLNGVSRDNPKIIVPLVGPAADATAVRRSRDSLAWLRGRVAEGFVDALDPDEIPDFVMASPQFSDHFEVGSSPEFVRGLIVQAVDEALAQRGKRSPR